VKTLHQVFDRSDTAERVVAELEAAGFTSDDVTMLSGYGEAKCAEGVTAGIVVGSGAGLLASLCSVTIPGLGPLFAAGWLLPALTGGAVGALIGGFIGALIESGIPESDAHVYAETLRRGGALVIVRTDEGRARIAEAIFAAYVPPTVADRRRVLESEGWRRFEERAR